MGESFLEEKSKGEASTEIEISNKCYSITEKYLTDNILNYGWIDYKETKLLKAAKKIHLLLVYHFPRKMH